MCEYEGERNKSPAKKGQCRGESGYLAGAEIKWIHLVGDDFDGAKYRAFYDCDSDFDILVYNGVEWVAYIFDRQRKAVLNGIRASTLAV